MKLREIPVPRDYRRRMFELGGPQHAASFRMFESEDKEIRAHMSRSQCGFLEDGRPDLRWHISISVRGQKRLPTWDELKEVRAALKPEVFFVVAMPPERYWMNLAEVLHLKETKDKNAIQQWIFEGESFKQDQKLGIGYGSTIEEVARKRRKELE